MSARILIVEDDPTLRMTLRDRLVAEGFEVLEAADGEAGEALALDEDPDLVLLDVMLPKKAGFSVLRALRADRLVTPVILMTARGEEFDRIQGFESGADDYVVKPFSLHELMLRVRALLERARGGAPGVADPSESPSRVRFAGLELDLDAFTVTRGAERATLSRKERDLVAYFLRHEGVALERARIFEDVWGEDGEASLRTVDQHVAKLRKKLEAEPDAPRLLRTVHGVGYVFERRPSTR
ncbi:MAG: response regulator transcription factor [Planctomycetota bacterium]